jgi:general secretion pathway protein G
MNGKSSQPLHQKEKKKRMQATLERLRQRREEEGREGGFTLIELLIVIVILAILAAIVVFAVQNLTKESAAAACQSDFKTVETAAETFKAQTGAYPGGTYNSGVSVTAASSPGTGETDTGILDLMGTASVSGSTVGPWLKDYPYNANHYQISVASDGSGTITIESTSGTPYGTNINACSKVS